MQDNLTLAQNCLIMPVKLFMGGEKRPWIRWRRLSFSGCHPGTSKEWNGVGKIENGAGELSLVWRQPGALQAEAALSHTRMICSGGVRLVANASLERNPSIQASLNKLSMLELDQKLKREKLKPKLKSQIQSVDFHHLQAVLHLFIPWQFYLDFGFAMPLLLRKERELVCSRAILKCTGAAIEIDNKRNELQNKMKIPGSNKCFWVSSKHYLSKTQTITDCY